MRPKSHVKCPCQTEWRTDIEVKRQRSCEERGRAKSDADKVEDPKSTRCRAKYRKVLP
jgi:hypothetical protein